MENAREAQKMQVLTVDTPIISKTSLNYIIRSALLDMSNARKKEESTSTIEDSIEDGVQVKEQRQAPRTTEANVVRNRESNDTIW